MTPRYKVVFSDIFNKCGNDEQLIVVKNNLA